MQTFPAHPDGALCWDSFVLCDNPHMTADLLLTLSSKLKSHLFKKCFKAYSLPSTACALRATITFSQTSRKDIFLKKY